MAAEILSTVVSRRRLLLGGVALAAGARIAVAQEPPQPVFGTPGKDAGWIPTPNSMVEAMLRMARTTPADLVVDLGSGDGRIPILAAKTFGSRGMGVELNGDLVAYSQREAQREGLAGRVKFVRGDIFEVDFTQASVVTLFMPPSVLQRLKPKLLAMKPGTRILSYLFAMDDWDPDEWTHSDGTHGMLWIVPASVAGTWRFDAAAAGQPLGVRLGQKYQKLEGRLLHGKRELPLYDARLEGDRLRLTSLIGDRRIDFHGTVNGGALNGELHLTGEPLRKTRAKRA